MTHMKILYRRRRMIQMMLQCLKPTEIIQQLLNDDDVDVQESTLWEDWGTREEWMSELAKIDVTQQEVVKSEYFVTLKEARRLLFNTYLRSGNPKYKIESLKEIRANIQSDSEMRQTLGLLEREPIKHEVTQDVKANINLGETVEKYFNSTFAAALAESKRRAHEDRNQPDTEESLDPEETSSSDR